MVCKQCGEDVPEMVMVNIAGKMKKMCEDCAELAREAAEVAQASETAVQGMMEFKGRR